MRSLLLRGMFAGLLAAVVAFTFAKVAGEPAVDRAIAFEEHTAEANGETPEPEMVSRTVQSTVGLAAGIAATGVALGGFFAIAFAFAHGRLGQLRTRATALTVAGLGFVAVHLGPSLKYPANPPSVGDPDTLNQRTILYFSLIAVSVTTMVVAVNIAKRSTARFGTWNATLLAGGVYFAVTAASIVILPVIDEVPDGFPASTLWQLRLASTGIQLALWATIGLVFGALTERSTTTAASPSELAAVG